MLILMRYSLLTILFLLCVSCGLVYRQPIYQGNLIDQEAVSQLKPGLSRDQVIALLGTPSIADPFHAQRWDYTATQRLGRFGRTHMKNFVVYFNQDQLTHWEGNFFPNHDQELAQNANRQFGPNASSTKNTRSR